MYDKHKLAHALEIAGATGLASEQLRMIDQLIHILVNPGNVVVVEYVDYESGQDVKTMNLDASLDDLERIFSDYRHRLNMGESSIPGMPRFSDFKILRAMYAQDFIQNALINASGFTSKYYADFVKNSEQVIEAWRNANEGNLCPWVYGEDNDGWYTGPEGEQIFYGRMTMQEAKAICDKVNTLIADNLIQQNSINESCLPVTIF